MSRAGGEFQLGMGLTRTRRPTPARRAEAGPARHPEGRNVAADGEAVDTPGS